MTYNARFFRLHRLKPPRSNHWFLPRQTIRHRIDPQALSWLVDSGSLTRRLKSLCPDSFAVDVLGMEWTRPDYGEASLLNSSPRQRVLLRQVHLRCGERLCVYARSLIPLRTLNSQHRRLRYLGNKPLGEYLFASPGLKRSRIEWSRLNPASRQFRHAVPDQDSTHDNIWGRRSLFLIDQYPLLVSEFFLPVLFETR